MRTLRTVLGILGILVLVLSCAAGGGGGDEGGGIDFKPINVDIVYNESIGVFDNNFYTFVAPVDGFYEIAVTDADIDTSWDLASDPEGVNILHEQDVDLYGPGDEVGTPEEPLTSGSQYFLVVYSWDETTPGTFSLEVRTPKP